MLNKDFANLIPHAGSMSLIDELISWDPEHLGCLTGSHTSAGNPLRSGGILRGVHAIEYAGQACALHAGFLAQAAGARAKAGMLVGIKDVELRVERLDDLPEILRIDVHRVFGDADNAVYTFRLKAETKEVATGRLSVMSRRREEP